MYCAHSNKLALILQTSMQIILTPSFNDIFDQEKPTLEDLLSDIPSSWILMLLAHIDAQLYLNENIKIQNDLLLKLLTRQNIELKNQILNRYRLFMLEYREQGTSIFSRPYIKSFIHYIFLNYKEFEIVNITPKQDLAILKAYLIISSNRSKEMQNVFIENDQPQKGDFFPVYTWPILINQLDVSINIDPISNLIKGICLLNYLQYHSEYSEYVETFLHKNNKSSSWEYMMAFMDALKFCWEKNEDGETKFYIPRDENLKSLFDNLTINPTEYKSRFNGAKENLVGLKSKPLYRHNNSYIVLDWNFISNKMYDGLIFDFLNTSGIKASLNIKSLPDFKRLIGYEITEKFVFNRLLKSILTKKHSKLIFPETDINGEPDAYYRYGNSIILFEIKDAFFPANAIDSCSYEQIKDAIDAKYNNKRKGISQFIKQIEKLKTESLEPNDYETLNIKPRNFKVYTILIYTDKFYGMPGVSNYLIQAFNKEIDNKGLRNDFKKISNLTFIDLNFLIRNSSHLRNNDFIQIIEKIQHSVILRKQKHDKNVNQSLMFEYNLKIEDIFHDLYPKKEEDDITEIMKLLEMTEGLP